MIVDSGAPVSITTSKWMEKCLKNMEVRKDDITENECMRKFKMDENIHLSNREIRLPVRMKTAVNPLDFSKILYECLVLFTIII